MGGGEDFNNAIVFRGNPVTNVLIAFFLMLVTAIIASSLIFPFGRATDKLVLNIFCLVLLLLMLFDRTLRIYRGRRVVVAIGEHGMFDWRISNA